MNRIFRHIITLAIVAATTAMATSRTDTATEDEIAYTPTFLMTNDISSSVTCGYRKAHRGFGDVDVIVIHSSHYIGADSFSTEGCIKQFRKHGVAPHYLIARDGKIYRMVAEKNIALHAGRSSLPGTTRTGLNASSIGIELINTRSQGPNYLQYAALQRLVKDICLRWHINYIVRHSDIAPERKDDPWCFDWEKFCNQLAPQLCDVQFPTAQPLNDYKAQAH
ncbi:MAG: N-acetylmuramoyl-L-alanine amidase [Muribaculaceae bacterium]